MNLDSSLINEVQKYLFSGMEKCISMALVNNQREYIWVNDKFTQLCRYGKDEIVGSTYELLDSGFHSQAFWDQLWSNSDSQDEWSGELCLRKKNGELFWSRVMRIRILFPEVTEPLFLELYFDISDLKLKDQELEKQKVLGQAGARFSILGQMIGGITHEINNPLTVILGTAKYFKMANAKNEITSELVEKNSQKIMDATNRIAKVTKVAKSLSRDGSKDAFSPYSIESLFDDINNLVGTRVRNHGITFEILPYDKSAILSCRPFEIMQALVNLIYNSDTAVRNSSNPWIRISYNAGNEFATFRVSDSGQGIPVDLESKIMEPFFTTNRPGTGMGLGLGLVQSIVKNHSGKFYLDKNSPNTSFVIEIPNNLKNEL